MTAGPNTMQIIYINEIIPDLKEQHNKKIVYRYITKYNDIPAGKFFYILDHHFEVFYSISKLKEKTQLTPLT